MKLYRHLAWDGIRKNSRLYVPYLLTGVGAVSFFYILVALARLPEGTLPGSGSVQVILNLGSFVLWVFSLLLLFYTHSFLIRRRNREFALYNVLGMGKGDISRILCWESLLSGGLSLLGGLALGVVLSKLAELGLMRVMGLEADMTYRVSAGGLLMALGLYGAIYLLILLSALLRVRRSTAIQLMRSEAVGEKPPRANWALALLGVLLLGAAYYLAVSIREPLTALTWFFAAVLMVIAATYLLFISGSVTLCRLLQRNPRFYYRKRHFVSVSSLVYRMKRNGAGLASICILGTMVLVMLSFHHLPVFRGGGFPPYPLSPGGERYRLVHGPGGPVPGPLRPARRRRHCRPQPWRADAGPAGVSFLLLGADCSQRRPAGRRRQHQPCRSVHRHPPVGLQRRHGRPSDPVPGPGVYLPWPVRLPGEHPVLPRRRCLAGEGPGGQPGLRR